MKKYLFLINFIGITFLSYSNNINVPRVTITGQNTDSGFTWVQLNISWDNSWRTSTLESNWDATLNTNGILHLRVIQELSDADGNDEDCNPSAYRLRDADRDRYHDYQYLNIVNKVIQS